MDKDDLENNVTDLTVMVAKSALGAVPYAGAFLSEIVGTIIPNQRVDRVAKYIQELDKKLNEIPEKLVEDLKNNEFFIDLVEESFFQASRAITEERREYIVSMVANGITNEELELIESKHLMKILQELNDIEIIWLRFYAVPGFGKSIDSTFREKHKKILMPVSAMSNDFKIHKQRVLQESYKEKLERLGLIEKRVKFNRENRLPEFDRNTGKAKVTGIDVTFLGKILLEQIGLLNSKEKKYC